MFGQQNVRASTEDNTGQKKPNKGHTPNPRKEIKIPDPARNRIRSAGLEGRDSADHATATDHNTNAKKKNIVRYFSINPRFTTLPTFTL